MLPSTSILNDAPDFGFLFKDIRIYLQDLVDGLESN